MVLTFLRRFHSRRWDVALACAVAMGVAGASLPGPESPLFASPPGAPAEVPLTRFEFEQVRFAAPVRLIVYAPSEAVANKVSGEVFSRLKHFDRVMSDYDPVSELSKLCATAGSGTPVKLSDELFEVIAESQRLAVATEGAFDITVAPVVKLWRSARRKKELPTPAQQAAAMSLVGYHSVKLDATAKTVELMKPGMQLDLGGIAQGYAADDAMRVLKGAGLTRALVDVSGDIRVGDAPPGRDGWKVEIEALRPPKGADSNEPQLVTLTNAAISTAGDAYQSTEIDGVRYSHIIDARTGRPMTQSCSVTVIAPDALTADGLDTALCVLEPAKGRALVKGVPGVRVFETRIEGEKATSTEYGERGASAP
ncbi:MAG TPA: FAD:protein FMN transferase [Caulifigura sp.]|nr:FAD:protein FMN transferase [Caulifigura sp.]